ncbi:MAG TPA: hypothetical protein PLJ78_16295, partial [Anaerolineae bacterium]|nr:hypothetical protein [Anaerolineae bacterium]HQK15493.1 hypothetical protein [Anaerolineae bacterium]
LAIRSKLEKRGSGDPTRIDDPLEARETRIWRSNADLTIRSKLEKRGSGDPTRIWRSARSSRNANLAIQRGSGDPLEG